MPSRGRAPTAAAARCDRARTWSYSGYEDRRVAARWRVQGRRRLARKLGKSRSQLYSDALTEYLARHGVDAVTEAMNDVVAEVDEPQDELVRAAVRRTLGRSEW